MPRFCLRDALLFGGLFVATLGILLAVNGERRPIDNETQTRIADAARAHPSIQARLATSQASAEVTDLDGRLLRVTFIDGPRVVAEAAVDPNGTVEATKTPVPGPRYGTGLSNAGWVLGLLCGVFAFVSLRRPIVSLGNLDALACVGFVACILAEDRLLAPTGVVVGAVLLAYLGTRCVARSVGTARRQPRSRSIVDQLISARPAGPTRRVLVIGVGALSTAVVMIATSARDVIDVGFASLSGATLLNRGILPYGNMPEGVLHGDTYPLLNYVVYMPGAALSPVEDAFGDIRSALVVAAFAALLMAFGTYRAARRLPGHGTATGLRAAILVLAFPTTAMTAASGSNDVLLGAAIAFVLAFSHHAARSSLLLTIAAWIKLAPVLLVPVWLVRFRRRSLMHAVAMLVLVSAGSLTWVFALDGVAGIHAMVDAISFQFTRSSPQSVWAILGISWLQPAAQAGIVAFAGAIVLRTWRTPDRFDDIRRVAATIGALLIGLQLTANNWATLYVAWIVPALVIALLLDPSDEKPSTPAITPSG